MSFWPAGFDFRAPVVAMLDLVSIGTADGEFGYILGVDGVFTDVNGRRWLGSSALGVTPIDSALNGTAPEGSLTLSYFQDPDDPDVITQLRAQGADYVRGRPVRFYVQPIRDHAEFYAPALPPLLWRTRMAASLSYRLSGAQDRSITLSFESIGDERNIAQATEYSVAGHQIICGHPNPSLEWMPDNNFEEQKLFG